jgi:hypothetical protein
MSPQEVGDGGAGMFDAQVRIQIYRHLISRGKAPSREQLAESLREPVGRVNEALERLDAAHAILLDPSTRDLLRAPPFWTTPTPFRVESGEQGWWGSCIWDALGIPSMLQCDARIVTSCGCCSTPMTVEVRSGKVKQAEGVIHFAVPARRWYEDIVFT